MPLPFPTLHARVAELADAQDSGSCVRKDVRVQIPPRAHHKSITNQNLISDLHQPLFDLELDQQQYHHISQVFVLRK